jgi:hypothetical protein
MLFEDFRKYLEEKLLILGGGKKYDQAVILAGGAGSGKSFATKHFIQGENYKIINPDDLKEMLVKLAKKANVLGLDPKLQVLLPKIREFDLNKPEDTSTMHMLIKDLGLDDKQLFYILGNPGGTRTNMPNLMFDMTLKSEKAAREVTSLLLNAGYKPENIHIVWVLTDYKMALQQNYHRDRRVFNDILFDPHLGAKQTMQDVVIKNYGTLGINGDLAVIVGGPKHSEIIKSNSGKEWAKDFTYFRLKKAGQSGMDSDAISKIGEYIGKYAPPQQGYDSTIGKQFPQTSR